MSELKMDDESSGPGMKSNCDRRVNLIRQFCELQWNYCNNLCTLSAEYMTPLQRNRIISSDDYSTIFRNIDNMIQLQQKFVQELRQMEKRQFIIHKTIYVWMQQFEIYNQYFKGHSIAKEMLQNLYRFNPKFYNFCEGKSDSNLSMLLESPHKHLQTTFETVAEISSNTPASHPDAKTLPTLLTQFHTFEEQSHYHWQSQVTTTNNSSSSGSGGSKERSVTRYVAELRELCENEMEFVNCLTYVLRRYAVPIEKEGCRLITRQQFNNLFRNLNQILEYHQDFMSKLKKRCDAIYSQMNANPNAIAPNVRIVGDLFESFDAVLKLHSEYISAQECAEKTLYDLLGKNLLFSEFCMTVLNESNNAPSSLQNTLRYLLQLPCVRIIYLELQLKVILDCLPPNHLDFSPILAVTANLEQLRCNLDDCFVGINHTYINDLINSRIVNCNALAANVHRRYFYHGYLLKLGTFNQRNKLSMFVAFNDCIVVLSILQNATNNDTNHSSGGGNGGTIRREIVTAQWASENYNIGWLLKFHSTRLFIHKILPIDDVFSVVSYGSLPSFHPFTFAILSSVESMYVVSETAQSKQRWMDVLTRVIEQRATNGYFLENDTNHSSTDTTTSTNAIRSVATLYFPDSMSNVCMIEECGIKFPLNKRGRKIKCHCKYCGRLICSECGKFELPSWNKADTLVRVCKECFDETRLYNEDNTNMNANESNVEWTQMDREMPQYCNKKRHTNQDEWYNVESVDVANGASFKRKRKLPTRLSEMEIDEDTKMDS